MATQKILADAILLFHFAYVLFVVFGLALIWIGAWRRWAWVRNPWFRSAHLAAIGLVAAEAILGIHCPLTVWEQQLRRTGSGAFEGDFLRHWIGRLMFFSAPEWVFTAAYLLFGAIVLATWLAIRPGVVRRKSDREPNSEL